MQPSKDLPVIISDTVNRSSIAFWVNKYNSEYSHITGTIRYIDGYNNEKKDSISGKFGISKEGNVFISLSRKLIDNKYENAGVIFIDKDGYGKLKSNIYPPLIVRATPSMSKEVADAIGFALPQYDVTPIQEKGEYSNDDIPQNKEIKRVNSI